MTTLYNETTETGNSYLRASSITMVNSYGGTPRVEVNEQRVLTLGGSAITSAHQRTDSDGYPQNILKRFDAENANVSFDLIDPSNIESVVGSITYSEVYATMFSLYMHLATEADAANIS